MPRHNESQPALPLPPANTKEGFRRIRNYLAGRLVGATRDEALVEEVIKCVFCRALMVQQGQPGPDDSLELAHAYRTVFGEAKRRLPDIFPADAELLLDPQSIQYIHQHLAGIDFLDPDCDPIGDAYEAFIGSAVRGSEGQFFTPQNAARLLVELVDPQPGERMIDLACGAGGFLSATARHLARQGMAREQIGQYIFGIDKDAYLARLARAHLSLVTLTPAAVYCADSLAWAASNGDAFPLADSIGTYDIVLTNPPFGARIVAASPDVLRQFALGYRWAKDNAGAYVNTRQIRGQVPPQVLFVERCLALVKPGGRIGIVLPESLVSGKSHRHVVHFVREQADILAVLGMPESLFKTSGKGGTHTKTCLLVLRKREKSRPAGKAIFMAEIRWCGNDSRGKKIDRDELPLVAQRYRAYQEGSLSGYSHLGYAVEQADISDHVLAPRYYDPEVTGALRRLGTTHDLVTIRELVDDGLLEITSGHEVGKLAYGAGVVPFIRTSDISNWEIKLDPKHTVGDEVYEALAQKQDVREGDLLMVRDGTYLIGTCAYITRLDTRIVFQSHLYKLRVTDPSRLSPHLLLAALSSEPVQGQIKAKRFTQDIIDSLGDRIYELVLPLPKDPQVRADIAGMAEEAIEGRVRARERARAATAAVVSGTAA